MMGSMSMLGRWWCPDLSGMMNMFKICNNLIMLQERTMRTTSKNHPHDPEIVKEV